MVLREFCSMLLGATITIFTDHENLTFENFTLQRVLLWQLYLEDYLPTLGHKAGNKMLLLTVSPDSPGRNLMNWRERMLLLLLRLLLMEC
jgi:hypothetical protein